jgi:hypothetical protein
LMHHCGLALKVARLRTYGSDLMLVNHPTKAKPSAVIGGSGVALFTSNGLRVPMPRTAPTGPKTRPRLGQTRRIASPYPGPSADKCQRLPTAPPAKMQAPPGLRGILTRHGCNRWPAAQPAKTGDFWTNGGTHGMITTRSSAHYFGRRSKLAA